MTVLATGLLRARRDVLAELAGRRAAENTLVARNESLEQRLLQRTDGLRDMVTALESINSKVSHDVGAFRSDIGGLAGAASETMSAGDTRGAERMLTQIAETCDDLTQRVAEVLTLAHAGHDELLVEEVDLGSLVDDVLASLRACDASQAGLPVRVERLPRVNADPTLLRHVYMQLVGNALKFSAQAALPLVEVGCREEDGMRVFYVKDNGVGFDSDAATLLFEPFKRLHGERFEGHGMGLSIVRRIVERHGGWIWAQSRPGEGATFSFTLS
jgi:signal transduction histidine kinase